MCVCGGGGVLLKGCMKQNVFGGPVVRKAGVPCDRGEGTHGLEDAAIGGS